MSEYVSGFSYIKERKKVSKVQENLTKTIFLQTSIHNEQKVVK